MGKDKDKDQRGREIEKQLERIQSGFEEIREWLARRVKDAKSTDMNEAEERAVREWMRNVVRLDAASQSVKARCGRRGDRRRVLTAWARTCPSQDEAIQHVIAARNRAVQAEHKLQVLEEKFSKLAAAIDGSADTPVVRTRALLVDYSVRTHMHRGGRRALIAWRRAEHR